MSCKLESDARAGLAASALCLVLWLVVSVCAGYLGAYFYARAERLQHNLNGRVATLEQKLHDHVQAFRRTNGPQ